MRRRFLQMPLAAHPRRTADFCPAWRRAIMLLQMMESAECDVAAVTVGNHELSGLRLFSMFSR
jgi:hypothetical protein